MNPTDVVVIGRDLLTTTLLVAGPSVAISLVVGLVISLLQTVTSLQEQTLSFAPRIIAVVLVMLVSLPWTLQVLTSFTTRMFTRMLEVTG